MVPGATVGLTGPDSLAKTTTADAQGRYLIDNLSPGEYALVFAAPGFQKHEMPGLQIGPGASLICDARLVLTSVKEQVTVADTRQVDVDPSSNTSAIVLRGKDLDALSADPDELADDLTRLAGPAAGPSGAEIFVDGFSNAKLPPKASIREIRVNQNPFSAEYERLGYGRVEILTKPGADQWHGETSFSFNDSRFNSRNPFAEDKPDYQRKFVEASLGGPLTKRSSFTAQFLRRDIGEVSTINAVVLSPALEVTPFRSSVPAPIETTGVSGRLDYQLSPAYTLVTRYDWMMSVGQNAGLDTFSPPSRASTRGSDTHQVQLTETAILNPTTIQELRIQYGRYSDTTRFASSATAIVVPEAFASGGVGLGLSETDTMRWEVADVLSLSRGRHMLKFGARFRSVSASDRAAQNYNGTFTFASLDAYRITQIGLRDGLNWQRIRAKGGGASQFTIFGGDPEAGVRQLDTGVFVQEDWRLRPQLTLSAGLRYETQTNIGDRGSVASRVGFAWAPGARGGRQAPLVIRGGFGLFYNRVQKGVTLDARRLDGIHQSQYVVPNPDFYPEIPSAGVLAGYVQEQAVRRVGDNIQAAYTAQTTFSIERQIAKDVNLSVTYANSRGVHGLRSRNINAPWPDCGCRPFSSGESRHK